MDKPDTILVKTDEDKITRGRDSIKELKVEVLAENMNIFLFQVQSLLEKTPEELGKFYFDEITITAEVSANGKLVLLGSGVEAAAKGSLQFKFKRKINK